MLTTVGELKLARQPLEKSLKILETMPLENSGEEMGAVFLRLGNLARLENDLKKAKEFYERSEQMSGRSLLSLQAQINLFSLLIESEEKSAALDQRSHQSYQTSRLAVTISLSKLIIVRAYSNSPN